MTYCVVLNFLLHLKMYLRYYMLMIVPYHVEIENVDGHVIVSFVKSVIIVAKLFIVFQFFSIAWYDIGLSQYQAERQDTELERVFDERHHNMSQGVGIATEHHGQKTFKEPETEWQKSIKTKRNEEGYYSKLMDLEEEQLLKEARLRESSHQYAIPGEKIVSNSVAKGMAQKYQDNL